MPKACKDIYLPSLTSYSKLTSRKIVVLTRAYFQEILGGRGTSIIINVEIYIVPLVLYRRKVGIWGHCPPHPPKSPKLCPPLSIETRHNRRKTKSMWGYLSSLPELSGGRILHTNQSLNVDQLEDSTPRQKKAQSA